jgi:hypothetical protein
MGLMRLDKECRFGISQAKVLDALQGPRRESLGCCASLAGSVRPSIMVGMTGESETIEETVQFFKDLSPLSVYPFRKIHVLC